jgi:putative ABC transport system substrate-binding protein
MRRREFFTLIGGAVAWPCAARAQQAAMPIVGLVGPRSPEESTRLVAAFRKALNETRYIEAQNVMVEYHWLEGKYDRLPALMADLVRRRVAVIATPAFTAAAPVAKAATTTIPIVFGVAEDPVGAGLVASLSRPRGNLTGVTSLGVELAPKLLEVLHELIPAANSLAVLVNPTNPASAATVESSSQAAARAVGLDLHVLHASAERDFETVFTTLARLRAGGLVISTDGFLNSRGGQLGALAARHGVPTIAQYREFVDAGGFACYGGSVTELCRLVGVYAGRILKGEKPGDLPVQQSTKAELIINLKAARALGMTVPLMLLGRADEVIE